jgi:Flp pilus assembly protein TadD
LASRPADQSADYHLAVELAREAVDLERRQGALWNTLGIAFYRAGELAAAADALTESMRLRAGGDPYDWYFLAMVQQSRGPHEIALETFNRAERWMEAHPPQGPLADLRRFQAEAARTLKINEASSP